MRKFNFLYDKLHVAIKAVLIALMLLAISNCLININFNSSFLSSDYTMIIASLLKLIGNFIIANIPFFIVLAFSGNKRSSDASLVAFIGYITFLFITLIFARPNLGASYYHSYFGISLNTAGMNGLSGLVQLPLQTGIIGALLVGLINHHVLNKARNKQRYGFLAFIDRFSYAALLSIIYNLVIGIIISLVWPLFIFVVNEIIDFIASDINNPINIFIYGIFDRIFSVLGLGSLIRYPFWYQDLGGTWVDLVGNSYSGELNVFNAMYSRGIQPLGFTKFVSPYYLINLFVVPAILLAYYRLFTDKFERKRVYFFFIFAFLLSISIGIYLPIEMMMLFFAPTLFIIYLFIIGIIFALSLIFKINLGYLYNGSSMVGFPGNIFDLYTFAKEGYLSNAYQFVILGIIFFVVTYLVITVYYRYLALDLFNYGQIKNRVEVFITSIGGIDNVKLVNSSPFKLIVQLNDNDMLNHTLLLQQDIIEIKDSVAGYIFELGSASTIYRIYIQHAIKQNKREIE